MRGNSRCCVGLAASLAFIALLFACGSGDGGGGTGHSEPGTLMFCEPLLRVDDRLIAATVPAGMEVTYRPDSCEPESVDGLIVVRNADGTTGQITPVFVALARIDAVLGARDSIVWVLATGELNGRSVVMSGEYLETDSELRSDQLDRQFVVMNMTTEGASVFGSLSERLIGLPVSIFVDGLPLRGYDGDVIAPTIRSKITETVHIQGLSDEDAVLLRDRLNAGDFR